MADPNIDPICAPEYVSVPILPRSVSGVHDDSSAAHDGKIRPSPRPMTMRIAISATAPPACTQTGVRSVKNEATHMPTMSVYLPPYLEANTPPGTCVIT